MTLEEALRATVAEWRERYRTATPLSIASVAVHTCADELEAVLDAHETAEKSTAERAREIAADLSRLKAQKLE